MYDLIKSDDRSSLQRTTLNDYMIVQMRPVANYDLRKPTVKFIKAKNHRPQQHFTTKFKQQEFFVGFFEEARKCWSSEKALQSSFLTTFFFGVNNHRQYKLKQTIFGVSEKLWQRFLKAVETL